VYPVVLLFLEMPAAEVDVNVHPSKTEVRFRQQTVVHDFVRDAVREALMKARPVPRFLSEINAQPTATPGLTPVARGGDAAQRAPWRDLYEPAAGAFSGDGTGRAGDPGFALQAPTLPPQRLAFPSKVELPSKLTRQFHWHGCRRRLFLITAALRRLSPKHKRHLRSSRCARSKR